MDVEKLTLELYKELNVYSTSKIKGYRLKKELLTIGIKYEKLKQENREYYQYEDALLVMDKLCNENNVIIFEKEFEKFWEDIKWKSDDNYGKNLNIYKVKIELLESIIECKKLKINEYNNLLNKLT